MRIQFRRIYFGFVVLIFLVVAPLIILYTSGFRYDFSSGNIVRTGVLSLVTTPDDAEVFIDSEKYRKTTPTVVKNLSPSRYKVEIAKPGFRSWYKWFEVTAGKAVVAHGIPLILEEIPEEVIYDTSVLSSYRSPYSGKIALIDEDYQLVLFDPGSLLQDFSVDTVISLDPLKDVINSGAQFVFSSDERHAFLFRPGDALIYIIDLTEGASTEMVLEGPVKSLVSLSRQEFAYLTEDNAVYYFVFNDGVSTIEEVFPIYDIVYQDGLYGITESDEGLILYDLSRSSSYKIDTNIPASSFSFEYSDSNILAVKSPQNAYFLEKDGNTWDSREWQGELSWLSGDSSYDFGVLHGNEWEIWRYDQETEEDEILLRSAEYIEEALLHPSLGLYVVAINGRVEVREIDNRDHVNTYTIWEHPASSLRLSFDEKTLYFVDEHDGYLKSLRFLD